MLQPRRFTWLIPLTTLLTLVACNPATPAPTISPIADQTSSLGEALTVAVNVTGVASATVAATSSNQAVLPDAGIAVAGSGTDFTLTLTPPGPKWTSS